jgi:predicted ATP-grasp superfamily ATP-dependent carboligase
VVLDPENLYEVDTDVPDLSGAVLLSHFDGFMDAGSAGRALADHLLDRLDHRVIARFDVDRLIDYRSRRPPMTYVTDHWEDYETPELVIHLLHDTAGTPFLLLTGPEPDHEWERFVAAVRSLIERWEVRLSVAFHGMPLGVPHTRPLGVTAHATRTELVAHYEPMFNRLRVPASITALLELRLGAAGHDAVGFVAHVPRYLAEAMYPAAALNLLNAVARATGLSLPEDALREAARRVDLEIDRRVADSEEVSDVVRALEQQHDAFTDAARAGSLLADSVEHMPTAEELGSEVEKFLAQQRGPVDPQDH